MPHRADSSRRRWPSDLLALYLVLFHKDINKNPPKSGSSRALKGIRKTLYQLDYAFGFRRFSLTANSANSPSLLRPSWLKRTSRISRVEAPDLSMTTRGFFRVLILSRFMTTINLIYFIKNPLCCQVRLMLTTNSQWAQKKIQNE